MNHSPRRSRAALTLLFSFSLTGCAGGPDPGDPEDLAARESPVASRTAYVITEIEAANASLDAAARAEKYAAMEASPFAFYRATNHLFWKDLGASPALSMYGGTSVTRTWLGGDMHVTNTGSFDDDEGEVVYAMNDFDEALIGDYQLDVFRLAASLALVARENAVFSATDEAAFVDAFTESYLDAMDTYAGTSGEKTRKFKATNTYGLLDDFLTSVKASESRKKMLDAWTVYVAGARSLNVTTNPDLAAVTAALDTAIRAAIPAYRATLSGGGASLSAGYFQVKSVAARLHAGVGSLGTPRYYVLIEGASASQDDDRILDVKAQGEPSGFPYVDPAARSLTSSACGGNMALRTVLAYKALGYRVDDHLGTMTLPDGKSYNVRERSPYKDDFPLEDLSSVTRMTNMAQQWGEVLATQHARADQDADGSALGYSVDAKIKAETNGDHAGFRANVRAVVIPYADQVELDWLSFVLN